MTATVASLASGCVRKNASSCSENIFFLFLSLFLCEEFLTKVFSKIDALPFIHEGNDEAYDEGQSNHHPRTKPIQFQDHHDNHAQRN
ncbi:hypothetical protein KSZ_23940 [Dictyobacter formicarum]|uniref:Secreted protein n=1 Tax=Dictyobacter formicarum TaxID=2778368 RepID=A0ABQ3VEZ2_9CHLR|nr:hypothetical protein KSZ_23940 [Dictyobacter formicarum]